MKLAIAILTVALGVPANGFGADKAIAFEGTVTAMLTSAGTDTIQFVFTRKGNKLRIENTANKLEPINILDLATGRVRPNGGLAACLV